MADINGIPYVESDDLVSAYPTVSQALAQEVSDQLASKPTKSSGTTEPASPAEGDLWFDENTTPPTAKFYDGTSWQTFSAGAADFSDSATGTYTDDGVSYKYITFTASGTLTVTKAGFADVLVVGGGGGSGGSGSNYGSAGGGAGGHLSVQVYLPALAHTVTVGAGGAAGTTPGGVATHGLSGNASALGLYAIAPGGGGGAGGNGGSGSAVSGGNGGSGGGAANTGGSAGGALAGLGNAGGTSNNNQGGGGGGGANAAGGNAAGGNGGNGGNGVASSITGSSVTRAGGGGGGSAYGTPGTAGSGGGTAGTTSNTAPTAATANTGGGAGGIGGNGINAGAAGGSGVVIVRVKV